MRRRILYITLLVMPFSCKEAPPEPPLLPGPTPTIQLSVVDSGLTDLSLRVRLLDTSGQRGLSLKRDSKFLLFYGSGAPIDTVVLDEGLTPGQVCRYRAYTFSGGKFTDSASISAATLDTTSHRFIWFLDTLSSFSSSQLNGAYIVNDHDAWVVGYVSVLDSTGHPDPIAYNAAHWDGFKWTLVRIQFMYQCSSIVGTFRAQAVFGFNSNDVWFASRQSITRWNGSSWSTMCIPQSERPGIIYKMWGSSPTSMYVVGDQGMIVHYNGTTWKRLQTGTTLTILDIWGATDPKTGKEIVLCTAGDYETYSSWQLLRIQGESVTSVSTPGVDRAIAGVWFVPNRKYYLVGDGIFVNTSIDGLKAWVNEAPGLTQTWISKAHGTHENDALVVGLYGNCLHFNGSSWRNLQSETYLDAGGYLCVDTKGEFALAVGIAGPLAVALRGYHQ